MKGGVAFSPWYLFGQRQPHPGVYVLYGWVNGEHQEGPGFVTELKSLLMKVKEESEKAGLNSTFKKLRSWHLVRSFHGK